MIIKPHHSKNVPFTRVFVVGNHLMGSSPDIRVTVPVEHFQSLVNLFFQSTWTSIANDVKHSLPDPDIFVVGHFKNSLPEFVNVPENLAWAKLFAGFESDIIVLGICVFDDFVDILSVSTD